jgi:hypothetical protein
LVWQTRALNRPTFGIAPLTFGSQPCLNRGSQIGKAKLSVRKAEERHCKEGQEGRKEAPQAPALRSISAYGGDEVSHYQTRKDNWPHAKRCSDETGSAGRRTCSDRRINASALGELTKKLWDYIKKNKLQDEKKRTLINADDALKVVFGGKKQVSMFERKLQLFDFAEKPLAFRDFAEKPIVDCEALRQGGFRAKPGFFGRIKSLQHFRIFQCFFMMLINSFF